jgi:hypothetical protein
MLLATHDGARSWHRVRSLRAVGAVVTAAGRVYATAGRDLPLVELDAGRERTVTLPCGKYSFEVALAASGDRLFLAWGSEPGAGNQAKRGYVSRDAGATWVPTADPALPGYVGTAAIGAAGLFLAGSRMNLQDGGDGDHWTTAVTGSGSAGGTAVGFGDRRHGFTVDSGPPSALYLTDDGGAHWRRAVLAR